MELQIPGGRVSCRPSGRPESSRRDVEDGVERGSYSGSCTSSLRSVKAGGGCAKMGGIWGGGIAVDGGNNCCGATG